nr:2529_t:CDS:2 [Entrophospora candida]
MVSCLTFIIQLKHYQNFLDHPLLKVKQIYDIHWLSWYDAVKSICLSVEPLLDTIFETYSNATLQKIQHEYLEDSPRLGYNLSGFLTNSSSTSNLYIGNHKLTFNNGYKDDLMVNIYKESLMFYGELELEELVSVYGKKYLPDYPLEEWFGTELDSSSSICNNEFSSLSILSSLSSALSVEKSDNDWSFRWVDKKSSQILFNFANPGLRLPSCKILAGFDGWKNINKQEILDFKESSSLVVSSEKAIQIIFSLNRSVYFMAELHDEQKFKHNKYFALLPCAICWNSHYHCYSSLLRVKFALKLLVSKYAPSEFEADDNYTGNDENDRELPLETCRIIANEDWWKN